MISKDVFGIGERQLRFLKRNMLILKKFTANVRKVKLFCIVDLFFSDFCCEFHINESHSVKMECIGYMDEVIESIVSENVCFDLLSNLFVSK